MLQLATEVTALSTYSIGETSRSTGLSADTLRYYERIGLLPRVARASSGIRRYSDTDISRLQFIQRAQRMNFTLAEIAELLKMRAHPRRARNKARKLTQRKLSEIDAYLVDLKTLRDELQLLLGLCASREDGCAIIEGIDKGKRPSSARLPTRCR